MPDIQEYLPILIPLGIIQAGLLTASLIHIFTHRTFRFGNRALWAVLCIVVNLIGPILYFTLGRGEEADE